MTLVRRQIDKITAETTLQAFKEGRQPRLKDIAAALKENVGDAAGMPTMKVRNQKRKQRFNIENFNRTLCEVAFDLDIAYEELVDIISSTLRRLNFVTVSYQAQSQQLEELIATLDNLLFSISNADDNFFGVFDTFESLKKVDTVNTTPMAVDLAEKAVYLPANNLTGRKINMAHLYGQTTWPTVATSEANIVSNKAGSEAAFGNAFSDINSVWRQDVITDSNTPVTLEVDIPISAVEEQEIGINRIQLIPHTTTDMKVTTLFTTDGINYLRIRGTEGSILLKRQAKTYNFDFVTTRVERIRLQITKESADDQRTDGTFRFSFGFKHIGFYTLGRQFQAELRSQPLSATGMRRPIDKVSLRAKEQLIDGTDIQYFVAPADTAGEPIGEWRPITPITRDQGIAPRVVRFSDSSRRSISITAADGPTISVETFRAINFYSLPLGVQTGDEVIFGTAKLYRGYGAWNRNVKKDRVLRQVKDSYISFNPGDVQQIYAIVTETAAPSEAYQTFPGGGQSTILQTALTVSRNIHYLPNSMPLIPPANVDVNLDQRPNYAVYNVLRYRSQMTIELEQIVLNGEVPVQLAEAHPLVGLTSRPIVQNDTFPVTITYTEGIDYNVVLDNDGRPTGEINRIATGNIGDGATVQVTYELNPDITHLVDAARDNVIYLESLLDIDEDDRFEVTYRFVPRPTNNTIVKSTIRVTSRFGDAIEGTVYEEGPDYSINIQQGTITRIPAGNIQPDPGGDISVYIDFFYRETPDNLHTYSTWVYQSRRTPAKFAYAPLDLNLSEGERFIINTNQGQTLDITERTESPELQFGWHNIIVRSLDPTLFNNSAIQQITTLVDTDNDFVFVRGGKYFQEIQANRSPMKQVTLDFLRTSVLPVDYTSFAINDNGQVILNFQPGSTEDLYLFQVRFDPNNANADANGFVTGFFPEEFLLEYRYRTDQLESSNRILLRALLSRITTSDGGITPKLHSYDLRLG